MKKVLMILTAVIGLGFTANAQLVMEGDQSGCTWGCWRNINEIRRITVFYYCYKTKQTQSIVLRPLYWFIPNNQIDILSWEYGDKR